MFSFDSQEIARVAMDMSGSLENVIGELKQYQNKMEQYKPKLEELEGYHQVDWDVSRAQCFTVEILVHPLRFVPLIVEKWHVAIVKHCGSQTFMSHGPLLSLTVEC